VIGGEAVDRSNGAFRGNGTFWGSGAVGGNGGGGLVAHGVAA